MFEIGNSLRDARERQGLDYAQIELATKIRAKFLRALEEEEFDLLQAETYVKGFLRTYANFLGLDGQLYVDEYNSRYVVDGFDDMPARRSPRARRERGLERKVLLLALAGIAGLTALVFVAWKFGGGSASDATPVIVTQQAPVVHTTPGLALTGVGKGSYVEVRRGSAAGTVLLQGTIPGGKTERVTGTRFWLYLRRPARLHVRLGGKAVTLPARRNLRVIVTPTRTALAHG
jgi:hypothetical protein